jgi:hypothetical protein
MKLSTYSIGNRRDVLKHIIVASAATFLLAACTTMGGGNAKNGPIYTAIAVDVGPVRAKNIGAYADKIAFYQKQAMDETYSGNIAPGNKSLPALTVEIGSISFGDSGGMDIDVLSSGITHSSSRTTDTLEGFAILRMNGREVRRQKILAVHISGDHGRWSMSDDEKRLIELTQFFAYRLRQELGD